MRTLFLFLILSASAFAQTFYGPAPNTSWCQISGATNATPIVVTVSANSCGLTNGALIIVQFVEGNTAANINANSNQLVRKVASLSGTSFNLQDGSGTSVAGNGTYTSGTGIVRLAQSYTIKSAPVVWLDGSGGTFTGAMSNTGSTGRANSANAAYAALTAKVNAWNSNSESSEWGGDIPNSGSGTNMALSSAAAIRWLADGDSSSLTSAEFGMNNVEMLVGTPACDETASYCNGRVAEQDFSSIFLNFVAQAYSIVRGQLTSAQRTRFTQMMLNDNLYSSGGIDTTACTKQTITTGTGTLSVTTGSTTVTGSGTSWNTAGSQQLSAGMTLYWFDGTIEQYAQVASVTDNTHFVATSSSWHSDSGASFYIVPAWTSSNCGIVWFQKHHEVAPLNGGSVSGTFYGPVSGGGGSNTYPEHNLAITKVSGWIALGLATCQDDARGCLLLEQAWEYWYDLVRPYTLSTWTGTNQSATNYGSDRTLWMEMEVALMMRNSVTSGIDITTDPWIDSAAAFLLHSVLPYGAVSCPAVPWGCYYPTGDSGEGLTTLDNSISMLVETYMSESTTNGKYLNYFLRNTWPGPWSSSGLQVNNGAYLTWEYVFPDPAGTATNYTSGPLQYVFNANSYSTCNSTIGFPNCSQNSAYNYALSRTGWTSSDTFLSIGGPANNQGLDHSGSEVGPVLQIGRNLPLMGSDNSVAGGNQDVSQDTMSGVIELGGSASYWQPGGSLGSPPAYIPVNTALVTMPRWASGGNGAYGPSSNSYAYAMVDASGAYTSSANAGHVYKHTVHFKKPGAQDYVVTYVDVGLTGAISGASGAAIREYQHMVLNGIGTPSSSTAISASRSAGTLSNTQASAKLNLAVLATGGSNSIFVNTQNSSDTDGSYTGDNGYTWRWGICASTTGTSCNTSATSAEWATVLEPINGTTGSMPTLTQLTSTNFRVIQIADPTTPKVAAFATGGSTYTALSFTSNHAGTAQYLLAGMAAGTYKVTVGGTPVAGSPFTVNTGDNTIYFESTAGAVVVSNNTPMFTAIAVSDIGQHYCRVVGNISPNAYVQVYYGTTSGGPYPYNTYPYLTTGGVFALDMGALASGTTFYYVVQARPDINDTVGQVQSSENICTTTSGSPLPLAPVLYKPNYPNTASGYTAITMTTSGGAYVAASTVTHTGGVFCASDPSWTVTAGDTIPTILSEVKFGAIIELPQATTGNVPDTNNFNGGFNLPVIAVDPCASGISDPAHRWIIFRTHQVNAADFPPFGFRTGPAWASNLATLQAQVPTSVLYTSGQIFEANLPAASATPIHHYWFSNLEFSVNSTASNGPWGPYFQFGVGEGNPADGQTPPSYIVLDRIYFNTPAAPAFSVTGIAGTVGANVMLIGNYVVGFQRSGSLGQGIYIEDCSTGPLSILNNEVDAAGQGIYFESVSEPACGAGPPVMMQNAVVQRNAVYEPPSWLNPQNAGYGAWDGVERGNFRNPFESKNCQICLIQGNWIDGSFSGQNSGEAFLVIPVQSANKQTGATGAHDLEISYNYVRHASVFADVWGTSIIDSCCGHAPDAALNTNVLISNNLGVDLGRYLYTLSGSVGGLYSNYLISYGVQNHLIQNNSFDFINADFGAGGYFIPMILGISDGGISSNGFGFAGNVLYFSRGVTGATESGIVAQVPICSDGCATFPVVPFPTTTTYATSLQTTMVQIGSTVTSSSNWGGNTLICGTNATGAEPWPDLDQADCTAITAGMPTGDSYAAGNTMAARQAAAGLLGAATKDMRVSPTAYNFGGAAGANIQGVLSALGIVKNIVVLLGASSLQFSYTAPDDNACSVDTSPNGSVWTRSTASGGSRDQTILVTGLSASSTYQYRLMCSYSQSRPWFSFPSEPSNMTTEGSATTAAASTGTVSVHFSLPSGAASAKVTLTPLVGTAATATCSSSPCNVAGVTNGANQETIQYWSGAGATGKMLSSGSTWLP